MQEKTAKHSNTTDIAEPFISGKFKRWLMNNFGSTPSGIRHWFMGAVIAFLIIGFFPTAPIAFLIVTKVAALAFLLISALMATKGLWDGYGRQAVEKQNNTLSSYLFEDLMLQWLEKFSNRVRFFLGLLFFMGILILSACAFPGVESIVGNAIPLLQPLLTWIGSLEHFFSSGFLSVFGELLTQTTASIAALVFLNILSLCIYDRVFAVVQWTLSSPEKESFVSVESNSALPRGVVPASHANDEPIQEDHVNFGSAIAKGNGCAQQNVNNFSSVYTPVGSDRDRKSDAEGGEVPKGSLPVVSITVLS